MKRSHLALAIAGLLASSSSFALISTADAPVKFAKGIKATQSSMALLPTNTDMLDVQFLVGFGFPKGTTQFIRVDLSNGAVFNKEPECVAPAGVTCNKRGVASTNKSFATFAIKADTVDVAPGNTVTIQFTSSDKGNGAGIKVGATDKDISIQYTLHNNDVSADVAEGKGTGALGSATRTYKYVSFASPLTVAIAGASASLPTSGTVMYSKNTESEVSSDFKSFVNTAPVEFGKIKYSVDPSVYLVDGTNIPATNSIANLLSTGSTIEIGGNFAFLQDVVSSEAAGTYNNNASKVTFKTGGADCATGTATPATKVAVDKVILNIEGNVALPGNDVLVCVEPNGVTPIEPFVASVKFNPIGKNELALDAVILDKFTNVTQNGTVLDTPYLSTNADYTNRIIITNTSSRALKYKVMGAVTDLDATGKARTVPLKTTTAEGMIPANANLFLKAEDLIDVATLNASGSSRVALRISVAGANSAIQGVAQTIKLKNAINGGAGDLQTVPMVRKCGGSGCNN